jgi:hypothetical protein
MSWQNATWQASHHVSYAATMPSICERLHEIRTDAIVRVGIVADPCAAHRRMFSDFTPNGCRHYAGTVRGSPNTDLVGRVVSSDSQLGNGPFVFVAPEMVPQAFAELVPQLDVTGVGAQKRPIGSCCFLHTVSRGSDSCIPFSMATAMSKGQSLPLKRSN